MFSEDLTYEIAGKRPTENMVAVARPADQTHAGWTRDWRELWVLAVPIVSERNLRTHPNVQPPMRAGRRTRRIADLSEPSQWAGAVPFQDTSVVGRDADSPV
jgi:hypothetical protein